MNEKRREELQPLVDAARELPPDEREKAKREVAAITAIGANLFELSDQCEKQPGALTWTLMQTIHEGRRGFQLFVFDHKELGGEYVVHFNASTLGEVAAKLAWLVEHQAL